MNKIQEIDRINNKELANGIYGGAKGSWHHQYRDSAWVYIGGLDNSLTEGDIICFMSQWGEVEDINLVRDKDTNKSKGFCFLKYEDQRSTILAVDNCNGIALLKRHLSCDHVEKYRLPKEIRDKEGEAIEENPNYKVVLGPGHAYKDKELANEFDMTRGQDLWARPEDARISSKRNREDIAGNSDDIDSIALGIEKDLKPRKSKEKHKKEKHKKEKKKRKGEHKHSNVQAMIESSAATTVVADAPQYRENSRDPGIQNSTDVPSWRGRLDPTFAKSNVSYGGTNPGSSDSNVCYAFQKGECTRGDSCKYSHGSSSKYINTKDASLAKFRPGPVGKDKWSTKKNDTSGGQGVGGFNRLR
jgi:RNA-binding motif protein, X-linked 2